MLFLSEAEKNQWREMGGEIVSQKTGPEPFNGKVRDGLLPVFRSYVGAILNQAGEQALCREWFTAGVLEEAEGLFFNAYVTGFLSRQGGRLVMPEVVFSDPAPYVHFTTVPAMQKSRAAFFNHLAQSLPGFDRPVKIVDLGCGDGSLTATYLEKLLQAGKFPEIEKICLVDASPAMVELAEKTVGEKIGPEKITAKNQSIQQFCETVEEKFDLAVSSLAFHHMPYEDKAVHLAQLKPWIDNFVLFELDANNDTPELNTPELILSVYQSYGRIIDFVFAHDAPMELANTCVDNFLMTEAVSLLTQPRGERNDYHMLQTQWNQLFGEVLAPEFAPLLASPAYEDDQFGLFTLHWGR